MENNYRKNRSLPIRPVTPRRGLHASERCRRGCGGGLGSGGASDTPQRGEPGETRPIPYQVVCDFGAAQPAQRATCERCKSGASQMCARTTVARVVAPPGGKLILLLLLLARPHGTKPTNSGARGAHSCRWKRTRRRGTSARRRYLLGDPHHARLVLGNNPKILCHGVHLHLGRNLRVAPLPDGGQENSAARTE